MSTVAALYVDTKRGPYRKLPNVDCWGMERDATGYHGPHPVVAHPPCGHWGRYAHKAHDDGHTGPVAVSQVRTFGGVLEHPRDSKLWAAERLPMPGWMPDAWGGYTLEIYQRDWGHAADKPTWLYVVGCPPNRLPPMPPPTAPRCAWVPARRLLEPTRLDSGRPRGTRGIVERMSKTQRHLTPDALAEWLIALARRCQ